MKATTVRQGDIVFVGSDGLVGFLIRCVSRRGRESRTYVNHVAMVVESGWIVDDLGGSKPETWEPAILMDAQPPRVARRSIEAYRGELVAVYRPKKLDTETRKRLAARAARFEGRLYGFFKIVLHLVGLGALARVDRWPICSYTVAVPYAEEGLSFGVVGSKAADPDDIWDFVTKNPHLYECVRELKPFMPQ